VDKVDPSQEPRLRANIKPKAIIEPQLTLDPSTGLKAFGLLIYSSLLPGPCYTNRSPPSPTLRSASRFSVINSRRPTPRANTARVTQTTSGFEIPRHRATASHYLQQAAASLQPMTSDPTRPPATTGARAVLSPAAHNTQHSFPANELPRRLLGVVHHDLPLGHVGHGPRPL